MGDKICGRDKEAIDERFRGLAVINGDADRLAAGDYGTIWAEAGDSSALHSGVTRRSAFGILLETNGTGAPMPGSRVSPSS